MPLTPRRHFDLRGLDGATSPISSLPRRTSSPDTPRACASRRPASFSMLASRSMARCARALRTSGVVLMKNLSLISSVRSFFAIRQRVLGGFKVRYSLDGRLYLCTIGGVKVNALRPVRSRGRGLEIHG